MATLTYSYADSTAVVGPLTPTDSPHAWDLCAAHAARITAPRGWEMVRVDLLAEEELPLEVPPPLSAVESAGGVAPLPEDAERYLDADVSRHPVRRARREGHHAQQGRHLHLVRPSES